LEALLDSEIVERLCRARIEGNRSWCSANDDDEKFSFQPGRDLFFVRLMQKEFNKA
jgi:hypothetical protein